MAIIVRSNPILATFWCTCTLKKLFTVISCWWCNALCWLLKDGPEKDGKKVFHKTGE